MVAAYYHTLNYGSTTDFDYFSIDIIILQSYMMHEHKSAYIAYKKFNSDLPQWIVFCVIM